MNVPFDSHPFLRVNTGLTVISGLLSPPKERYIARVANETEKVRPQF